MDQGSLNQLFLMASGLQAHPELQHLSSSQAARAGPSSAGNAPVLVIGKFPPQSAIQRVPAFYLQGAPGQSAETARQRGPETQRKEGLHAEDEDAEPMPIGSDPEDEELLGGVVGCEVAEDFGFAEGRDDAVAVGERDARHLAAEA